MNSSRQRTDRQGFRNNVIFPCGTLLADDGQVKLYSGAADTVVCLATARLDDLLALRQERWKGVRP